MANPTLNVLFAGGGTGGHIFPNVAVLERLREKAIAVAPHFLVSTRPLDTQVLNKLGLPFTAVPAEPMALRPDRLLKFLKAYRRSEAVVAEVIRRTGAEVLVATGGFVSGPAATAARKAGLRVALVNLDAVPGRANRFLANKATDLFSVYPTGVLPRAQTIGLPLRREALALQTPRQARKALGLDPDRETLLIFAGSQGGASLNQMMMELVTRAQAKRTLAGDTWQVLHLSGFNDRDAVHAAYEKAGVKARVEPFCNAMGAAWAATTLAVARSGAGTVGEAWANAVPSIFLPYPFHKDEHQKFNCEPLVNAGAALMLRDQVDPIENATQLMGPLLSLMHNTTQLQKMRSTLQASRPQDGAETLANWLAVTAARV